MTASASIEKAFELARERYAELGVDVQRSLAVLRQIPISLHCWQTDDLGGFENTLGLTGGIQATGNYPGKARTADEVRQDLDQVVRLLPGRHRLALHAIYGESAGRKVARDEVGPEHFSRWIEWARRPRWDWISIRPFSRTKTRPTVSRWPTATPASANSGFAMASPAARSARLWPGAGNAVGHQCLDSGRIQGHAGRSARPARAAAEVAGRNFRRADRPAIQSRRGREQAVRHRLGKLRRRLARVLSGLRDHQGVLLTLDAGHYHPTEGIADKISSVLLYVPEILLHVSRGVRWDSDHVVTLTDDLRSIAEEIIRAGHERVHCGLDFFDASINRVAAYVIGTRAMLKALLLALLNRSNGCARWRRPAISPPGWP